MLILKTSELKLGWTDILNSLTRKKAGVSLVNSDGITIFAPVYYNKV